MSEQAYGNAMECMTWRDAEGWGVALVGLVLFGTICLMKAPAAVPALVGRIHSANVAMAHAIGHGFTTPAHRGIG